MIKDFSTNKSRLVKLLLKDSFALLFFSMTLLIVIGFALFYYTPEKSIVVITVNVIILCVFWTYEYIRYYKIIFFFKRINSNSRLVIDIENLTIQTQSRDTGILSDSSKINNVTLYSHIKNKLPFENPDKKSDKIENFLSRQTSNNLKYEEIWYLEISTDDSKTHIMTPLMLNIDEIPFKEIKIIYDENFITSLKKYNTLKSD